MDIFILICAMDMIIVVCLMLKCTSKMSAEKRFNSHVHRMTCSLYSQSISTYIPSLSNRPINKMAKVSKMRVMHGPNIMGCNSTKMAKLQIL